MNDPWELAKHYFVKEGRSEWDIIEADLHGVDMVGLRRRIKDEKWEKLRVEHRKEREQLTSDANYGQHRDLGLEHARDQEVMRGMQMRAANLMSHPNLSVADIRSAREYAEAVERLQSATSKRIQSDREIRGIKPGTASSGTRQEVVGVEYIVTFKTETLAKEA
jgi:hypothetical protein